MEHRDRFKKFTIMLVPDNTKSVRQIRMPYFIMPIILLLIVSWVTYLGWIIVDYQTIKPQISRLVQLENESQRQESQFMQLAERLEQAKRMLEEIRGLRLNPRSVHKPRRLAQWDAGNDNIPVHGIGGSYMHLVGFDGFMNEKHQEHVLDVPTLLAGIDDKIRRKYGSDTLNPSPLEDGLDPPEAYSEEKDTRKGSKRYIKWKIRAIANELGLDPNLALSMAKVESGFNPKLVSPKGAVGVLQVTPRLAWHDFQVPREKLFDPNVNIRVGLTWMKYLLKRFDHNVDLSLAAYNAGVSRVVRAGYKIPRIKETRNYVKRVKKAMKDETEA